MILKKKEKPLHRDSHLLVTIDLEDHSTSSNDSNFEKVIIPVIDTLEEIGASVTFFIVGEMIQTSKKLVNKLFSNGHEIGLHGYNHQPLAELGPKLFEEHLKKGLTALEDAIGISAKGYRAPFCSLTKKTLWAPELLKQHGFIYSSSLTPALNPVSGFPGAPKKPFLWECGLLELPTPVFGFRRFSIPLFGGAYLRLAPKILLQKVVKTRSASQGDWTHAHPYDFDTEENYIRRKGQGWLESKLLFSRRHLMHERFLNLAGSNTPTMQEFATKMLSSDNLITFKK
tara:strand:+ start:572 stop:1426 length:855 start_codon:yes stop_codon:yes gene_type:complete